MRSNPIAPLSLQNVYDREGEAGPKSTRDTAADPLMRYYRRSATLRRIA